MYSRCLVCRAPFPEKRVLEHVPRGERVAYDPGRGRLWVVCRSCRRWSLAPIEDRWEALEELEKVVSKGRAGPGREGPRKVRLLSKTDHIALFGLGPLEIVRVGEAELTEEAWWRYGQQLGRPRLLDLKLPELVRRYRYGHVAWRGRKECPGCGYLFTELLFADRKILVVRPGESVDDLGADGPDPTPTITRRCPRCRDVEKGGLHFGGREAELTLSRVMAFEHLTAASMEQVRAAAKIIEDAGGASTLVGILTKHGRTLGDLPPIGSMALEITAIEARERRDMRLELAELKFQWKQEEELAALVDEDLTPVPLLDNLIWKIRGR